MISSGRFDDIYVGDYINANGVTWLIADLDNYLHNGNQDFTKHHAIIIPATSLMNAPMNDIDTAEGGYANSKMATETLPSLVAEDGIIGKTFGSHLIEYQNLLSNRINSENINQSGGRWLGDTDEWGWYTRKCDLMSEQNVYGTNIASSSLYDIGIDNRQYAIFQLKPEFITSWFSYWLKDVAGATKFAHVGNSSSVLGIRPRFLIG